MTPKITVRRGDGSELELNYDNTILVMFMGMDELDHVEYRCEDGVILNYDPELIKVLLANEFPAYLRHDRPEWAIDRFMNQRNLLADLDEPVGDW